MVEAGVVTLVGMTTVVGFLGLLVALMHLSARIIAHFPGESETAEVSVHQEPEFGDEDARIAAALAVVASQRGGS